jgi:hypothetical protein
MKNMLYRHTDDDEGPQKVIADKEQQFIDCLQQIKTLGEEKKQCDIQVLGLEHTKF